MMVITAVFINSNLWHVKASVSVGFRRSRLGVWCVISSDQGTGPGSPQRVRTWQSLDSWDMGWGNGELGICRCGTGLRVGPREESDNGVTLKEALFYSH